MQLRCTHLESTARFCNLIKMCARKTSHQNIEFLPPFATSAFLHYTISTSLFHYICDDDIYMADFTQYFRRILMLRSDLYVCIYIFVFAYEYPRNWSLEHLKRYPHVYLPLCTVHTAFIMFSRK